MRVFAINLEATDKFHGVTLRLITITLVATLLYVTSRWSGRTGRSGSSWSFDEIAGEGHAGQDLSCWRCWPGTNCGPSEWPMPGSSAGCCCWSWGSREKV